MPKGLVDKSLLQRSSNGRYGIHELLRQYGAEKLSGSSEVEQATRNLHCSYFAEYLHKMESDLHGKDQRSILAEIEAEIENIRIGWNWAVEHAQIERLADMLESIAELHDLRGWSREGVGLFSPAEQKLSEEKESNRSIQILRGRMLMWLGVFSADFDTEENINRFFQTSLTILRESGAQRELAYTLRYSAVINNFYAEDGNELLCQESLNIFKELVDEVGEVGNGIGNRFFELCGKWKVVYITELNGIKTNMKDEAMVIEGVHGIRAIGEDLFAGFAFQGHSTK